MLEVMGLSDRGNNDDGLWATKKAQGLWPCACVYSGGENLVNYCQPSLEKYELLHP